jgi:hypothetical protein
MKAFIEEHSKEEQRKAEVEEFKLLAKMKGI